MANYICENCNTPFKRHASGARPIRFCKYPCYTAWRKANDIKAGCFKPGNESWNKGMKGVHYSPATEFKKGQESINKLPLGTVRVRQRKNRNESPRAWVKIGEPNQWKLRAVIVWENENGQIPQGLILHHKDRNSLNDTINNLELLTRAAHLNEHRNEFAKPKTNPIRSVPCKRCGNFYDGKKHGCFCSTCSGRQRRTNVDTGLKN